MEKFVVVGVWAVIGATTGSVWAQDKINAVASFSILGDLVEEVCGEHCDVATIVGPDADAHTYEPKVSDAIAIAEAEVVFVNGLGFETWSSGLIANSGTQALEVDVNVGSKLLLVGGEVDPHAWNDPGNVSAMVDVIATTLSTLRPELSKRFDENANAFRADMMLLVNRYKERLAALPATSRTVVTVHDAFRYMGRAFGLRFLAPIAIDGEAEPNARQMAQLINQINDMDVAALFVENINNPDLVAQIAKETGLSVGGRLYSDALSEKAGPATSYLSMLEYNMTAILAELEK